jgi:hypothetical protein
MGPAGTAVAAGSRIGRRIGAPGVFLAWLAACVVIAAVVSSRRLPNPPTAGEGGPLRILWAWDWGWYRHIATDGYPPGGGSEYAFFPLWPWLLRGFDAIGPTWQLSAALVLVATAAAFAGLTRLSPAGVPATRTAVALACFPGSSLLLFAYPDALALTGAVWACVLVRRLPAASGVLAGATALARPNGFLLALPLALASGRPAGLADAARRLPAVAAPIAGVVAVHLVFRHWSGTLSAFQDAQEGWGRTGPSGLGSYLRAFVADPAPQPALMVALALAGLAGSAILWRMGRGYRPWGVYAFAVVATTALSGSLQSVPRHLVFAFPLVWILSEGPVQLRSRWVLLLGAITNAGVLAITYKFPP